MGNPNRTIIIPRGTLNSDDVNVVVIPPSLQRSTLPLIVTSTTGNKLAARSLPIWGDELDPSTPVMVEEEPEIFEEAEYAPEFISTTMCASPREDAPQILHMSSKTVSISNEGPPESFEFSFDASEGVDQNVFQAVMQQGQQGAAGGKRQRNVVQPPPEVYENFRPPLNSTINNDQPPPNLYDSQFSSSFNSTAGSYCQSGLSSVQPQPVARRRRTRPQQQNSCC